MLLSEMILRTRVAEGSPVGTCSLDHVAPSAEVKTKVRKPLFFINTILSPSVKTFCSLLSAE